HLPQTLGMRNVVQQIFINMTGIIVEMTAARCRLLPGVPVVSRVAIEQSIDVVEEECVAIDIEDLLDIIRRMAQLKELVKRGIKRQDGAARMHASQELRVAPEVVHLHVLAFGFTQQFGVGAVKKKEPDGDGPVIEAETTNALGPLLL